MRLCTASCAAYSLSSAILMASRVCFVVAGGALPPVPRPRCAARPGPGLLFLSVQAGTGCTSSCLATQHALVPLPLRGEQGAGAHLLRHLLLWMLHPPLPLWVVAPAVAAAVAEVEASMGP